MKILTRKLVRVKINPCICAIISVSECSYHEERLLKHLLLGSQKTVKDMRPVPNDKDKVVVKMGLTLSQIIEVVSIQFVDLSRYSSMVTG